MNETITLALKKDRLNKLVENGKNVKSGGVVRRLRREIRNLERSICSDCEAWCSFK